MSDEQEPPQHRKSILAIPRAFYRSDQKSYIAKSKRPRWVLHMQAVFWRVLMRLGMFFHRLAPPQPPKPDFHRMIETTVSGISGFIVLHFYVPSDYGTQKRLWTDRIDEDDEVDADLRANKARMSIGSIGEGLRRRSKGIKRWGGYPVVINFHGGGFTLGSAHDDARWCGTVVTECNAVVVSVEYRLAPEHPFPTAVEDGVDAVIWIHQHAEELGINPERIALSGFSSGGNMAFTVPLRLYDHQNGFVRLDDEVDLSSQSQDETTAASVNDHNPTVPSTSEDAAHTSSTGVAPVEGGAAAVSQKDPSWTTHAQAHKTRTSAVERSVSVRNVKIRCIVPWYPSLDYTRTREERRATCLRADQELPALFTDLFDDSYLHPPKDVALDSPYLSPGVAPTALLREALPRDIIMHTCEWDMLLDEGQEFYKRLTSEEIGKSVNYSMIPGVPHGWDKAPNPWKPTPGVREHYLKTCKELKRIMGQRDGEGDPQPRRSIVR